MKRIKAALLASATALTACGGGAVLAVLGTLGAGGGDWYVDANNNQAGYQVRADCGAGNDICVININPPDLYQRNYPIVVSGNFGGCAGTPNGNVSDAVNVSIPGCFVGRFLSVNEMVSSDGTVRAFCDSFPDMTEGVWVDIQDDTHRFVFTSNALGCEIVGSTKRPLSLSIQTSNFGQFAQGFAATLVPKTLVSTLTIPGAAARTFSGEFVGASGLRLSRSGETIELQRQDLAGDCN